MNQIPRHNIALQLGTMAGVVNASFSSPTADAQYPFVGGVAEGGLLSQLFNGFNFLSVSVSLLLVLVAYDQCESSMEGDRSQPFAETFVSYV